MSMGLGVTGVWLMQQPDGGELPQAGADSRGGVMHHVAILFFGRWLVIML